MQIPNVEQRGMCFPHLEKRPSGLPTHHCSRCLSLLTRLEQVDVCCSAYVSIMHSVATPSDAHSLKGKFSSFNYPSNSFTIARITGLRHQSRYDWRIELLLHRWLGKRMETSIDFTTLFYQIFSGSSTLIVTGKLLGR
jgi:hypothetical protein